MIPMSSPDITDAERRAVAAVLDTPCLSMGPQVDAFEQSVAGYVGTAHAVAVNSGTSGLHLALLAAGVQEGDEVLTTPFSFIATANAILHCGATPVFVDVEPDTGNIDPDKIEAAITSQAAAILPVHVFGQPAEMDRIRKMACHNDLWVIEDACEAIGSEYRGCKVGDLGALTVFAFYPNKQITTGEGGMVVTNDDYAADACRALRNQGRTGWLQLHTELGYNYRMPEMSAALGLAQMTRIEEILAKRERVAGWYDERLAEMELAEPAVTAPTMIASTTTRMSWFVYVVRILPPVRRGFVMGFLAAQGIPSRVYFTPIHLLPYYRERFERQRGQFPVAEYLGDVSLALPFSGVMTEGEVDTVCNAVRAAV